PEDRWRKCVPPLEVSTVEDEELKKFLHWGRFRYVREDGRPCLFCPAYEIQAVFTGRFDVAEADTVAFRERRGAQVTYTTSGFGHLNSGLRRLVLVRVERVEPRKISPSRYRGISLDPTRLWPTTGQ
ncbi:MAG: hypothetical protein MUC42_14680, partial [Bryobacter sp.]|nr:hypothetical protein [Bryobacter sp.]